MADVITQGSGSADTFNVKYNRVTKARVQEIYNANVSDEKWSEIERWLIETVGDAIKGRDDRLKHKRVIYKATLSGERSRPPFRQDASNLSTPLTIWASAGVRARLRTSILESDPVIIASPLGEDPTGEIAASAKRLVDFFEAEFRNPRALGGEQACDKCITDTTNYGGAGLKVYIEPDKVRYLPKMGSAEPTMDVRQGRVRWAYISPNDLIYVNGYGTDTQAMPVVGHQFEWSWQDILTSREAGYLDAFAVAKIQYQGGQPNATGSNTSAAFRVYEMSELYFDYHLGDDGIPTPLCAFFDTKNKCLLGLNLSYSPRGARPIWITQFDENPDPTNPEGQGVCEKLAGAQDETDLIHNLGIEAFKRAVAHLIVLKANSGAESELGGSEPILPGDHCVTEDPETDIRIVPLGTIQGVEIAGFQEDKTRGYVTSMLGLDQSAVGNVDAGKRVPASLGLEIKKDSRVITAHAISSFGTTLTEAVYYTFELYQQRLPLDSLIAACGREAAELLRATVFSASEIDIRSKYIVNFNALDAAATGEQKKQQLLVVGQYLGAYYDKLITYAQLASTLPPPLQSALVNVMQAMENSTKALLNTIEDIHNPDELIPKVSELAAALQAATAPAAGGLGGGVV
jgi:hypothetical protein